MNPAPRLCLAGSAGTGKTRLARHLARELGVPYVPEGMRERLENGLALHALAQDRRRALMDELWHEQREREAAALRDHGGFVADRSPYDFAAFWLHYGFHADEGPGADRLSEYLEAGRAAGPVLLCPWGVLPLEEDGVRSTNPWTQFRFQATLEGLLQRFARPGQCIAVPATPDFAARARAVLDGLGIERAPG